MCGIAGVLTRSGLAPPAAGELRCMAAMLRHRGPDGHGYYRDDRAGLAHTRLSLLDLHGGAQPLGNEDGSLWLVGNGEVFDHGRRRRELELRGHRFRTRSDMEVLLHAYEEWGDDAWSRLDAQFAAALWDARSRRLVLARDRFGIVPLYYAVLPDAVVFASEQKALFAGGRLAPALDADVVRQVFTFWSAPGPRTVFAGVRTVPAATRVAFSAELAVSELVWWQPDFRAAGAPRAADVTRGLRERLDRAVRRRLSADVPVGAYLSGGLDSAVLVALAADAGERPVTFSLAFDDPAFDETGPQQRVATLLGTEHHELRCSDRDIRDHLADVVWHCETPLMRTAPVPMFLLSDLARRNGIRAVLTGEGADELLAGYSVFLEDKVRRFVARCPASAARPALFGRVHDFVGTEWARGSPMWRAFLGSDAADGRDPLRSHRVRWRNGAWTTRVLDPRCGDAGADLAVGALTLPPDACLPGPLARAQAVEIATFMTPYLLCSQGDRVALAHGVEARYPYLAPEVAEFCSGLPDGHKLRGLTTKVALRRLAAELLPADVHRRRKRPYRAPIAGALLARSGDVVDAMLDARALRENPLLDAATAGRLVQKLRQAPERASERESMALCGLVTLQLLRWHFFDRFAAHLAAGATAFASRRPHVLAGPASHPVPSADIP